MVKMTPEQAAEVLRKYIEWKQEMPVLHPDHLELNAALETAIECMSNTPCQHCKDPKGFELGQVCKHCQQPFRSTHPATPTQSNQSESLEEIAIACLSEIHKNASLCSNNDEQHIFICGFVAGFNHSIPTPTDEFELKPCDNCYQLTNHIGDVCQKCKPKTPTDEQIGEVFDEYADFPAFQQPSMTRTAAIKFAREVLSLIKTY